MLEARCRVRRAAVLRRAHRTRRSLKMSLRDALNDSAKKSAIIADSAKLVDEEVSSKGGLSGLAIKAGYGAVKGVKPGFIKDVLEKLLPEFADKLDPLWSDGKQLGDP